jgi:hypothetical protein
MNAAHCTCPACIPLAATEDGGLVVWTLEQPSILLSVWPGNSLIASGACADVAYAAAQSWFDARGLTALAQFEIEQAIPRGAGLAADAMLRAATHAALGQLIPEPAAGGPTRAFDAFDAAAAQGGLLRIDRAGRVRQRATIAHDDSAAWVLVFATPRDLPDDAPEAEAHAIAQLANTPAPTAAVDALFRNASADDVVGFAEALSAIVRADCADAELRERSAQMRDIGALASGCLPTGTSAWALVHGGAASRTLRRALTAALGYFGPTVFAAVTNNSGITWRGERA